MVAARDPRTWVLVAVAETTSARSSATSSPLTPLWGLPPIVLPELLAALPLAARVAPRAARVEAGTVGGTVASPFSLSMGGRTSVEARAAFSAAWLILTTRKNHQGEGLQEGGGRGGKLHFDCLGMRVGLCFKTQGVLPPPPAPPTHPYKSLSLISNPP